MARVKPIVTTLFQTPWFIARMYGDLEEEEVVVAEAGNLDDQLKIQVRVL